MDLELSRLTEEVKKLTRRVDTLQATVDLLYKDRELLEDIQGSVAHLKSVVVSNQEHQDNTAMGVKAEVQKTQAVVENKVDEVRLDIQDKTVLITNKENTFKKLMKLLKRR